MQNPIKRISYLGMALSAFALSLGALGVPVLGAIGARAIVSAIAIRAIITG